MDFGIIYQLKFKKYWWLDTILYAVLALLLAAFFSYLIFVAKIAQEKKTIEDLVTKINNTGTAEQRDLEKQVFAYQKKIEMG